MHDETPVEALRDFSVLTPSAADNQEHLICQLPVHVSVESRIGRSPFRGGQKQPIAVNAVRFDLLPLARIYTISLKR